MLNVFECIHILQLVSYSIHSEKSFPEYNLSGLENMHYFYGTFQSIEIYYGLHCMHNFTAVSLMGTRSPSSGGMINSNRQVPPMHTKLHDCSHDQFSSSFPNVVCMLVTSSSIKRRAPLYCYGGGDSINKNNRA